LKSGSVTLGRMEVHFTPELEAKLNQVASASGRGVEQLIREIVEAHLDRDQWFKQAVHKGLTQLDDGEFIKHDEVLARIERLFRP